MFDVFETALNGRCTERARLTFKINEFNELWGRVRIVRALPDTAETAFKVQMIAFTAFLYVDIIHTNVMFD